MKFKPYVQRRDHAIKGFTKDGSLRFTILEVQDSVNQSFKNFLADNQWKVEGMPNEFEKHNLLTLFTCNFLLASMLYGEERCKMQICYTGKHGQNPLFKTGKSEELKIGSNLLDNFEDKELSYHFYSETIANGEVRGFFKRNESIVDEWRAPFVEISKIQYDMDKEFITYHRLFPTVSKYGIELINENEFNDYFKSSEQIYTKVGLTRVEKRNKANNDIQSKDIDVPPMLGLIVQKMPGDENEKKVDQFYRKIIESNYWEKMRTGEEVLDANKFRDLIGSNFQCDVQRYPLDYYCRCDRSTFKTILKQMKNTATKKSEQFAEESSKDTKVRCHYCNKLYVYVNQELCGEHENKSSSEENKDKPYL